MVAHLGRALAMRGSCLVILDNFEQLADPAAVAVRCWCAMAPKAQFLVTSRETLRIAGERLIAIGPLPVPTAGDDAEASALLECPSVALFYDRVRSVEPDFYSGTEGVALVAEIVRRLEGNPLAIELAASQMGRIGPRDLLRELGRRLLALEEKHQDTDPRHRSLRVAIDSSWRRLTSWEQAAFAQLSVFSGGFSADGIENVVDLSVHPEAPPPATVVASLRRRSMLRVSQADESPRWDMYEALRQYGSERASACPGEWNAVRERHARYFLQRGETWVSAVSSKDGPTARSALREELANLRAAWRWLQTSGQLEVGDRTEPQTGGSSRALRMAVVLAAALEHRLPTVAAAVLTESLGPIVGHETGAAGILTWALLSRARCYRLTGERELAEADLARVGTLATTEPEVGPRLRFEVGMLQHHRGAPRAAAETLKQALAEAKEQGALHLEASVAASLGWVLAESQDSEAFRFYRHGVDLFRSLGDELSEAWARICEAHHAAYFQRGQPLNDLRCFYEDVKGADSPDLEALALRALAFVHWGSGRPREGADLLEQSLELSRRCGMRREEALALGALGCCLEELGESLPALRAYEKAEEMYRQTGDRRNEGLMLLFRSGIEARRGDPGLAESLLEEGRALVARCGDRCFVALAGLIDARLNIARSRRALIHGPAHQADVCYAKAESLYEHETAESDASGPPSHRHSSLAFRFVLRRLEQDLREFLPRPAVRIWRDGSAFQMGDEPVKQLPRGPVIRHLLRALVERYDDAPNQPLTYDDLLQRVWPGEQILPTAAKPRVHTMIWHLRRVGLADVLLSSPEGYQLDPRSPIHLVD